MSLRLKGYWLVLVLPLQYLPGQRRKKKATQVKSLIEIFIEVVPWAAVSKACMTLRGRVRTLVEGEYSF